MNTPDLVVLDMAGTTVLDDGLVERAFVDALDELQFATEPGERVRAIDFVRATMGQSKISVFTELTGSPAQAAMTNRAFEEAYERLVEQGLVEPVPGARHAIEQLRAAGIAVAFTTGFARSTLESILDVVGWDDLADLTLSPVDAGGRGRPAPDLNLTALIQLRTSSVASMAVVGDTVSDMRSGVLAGAGWVIGVLSGAHDEARLRDGGATHVLQDVTQLPALLGIGAVVTA
jgi:phosphoglycolate phosphatase